MLELILNSDSNRRGRPLSLVALGVVFALALSVGACGEETSPTDGVKNPSSSDDEEEEDKVEPKPSKADSGAKVDASTKKDAGAKPPAETPEDPGKTAGPIEGGESAKSQWCQAKVVLDEYCTSCHDTLGTGGAPMSLLTHADLVAPSTVTKGKKVYEVVGTRLHDQKNPMPPRDVLKPEELKVLDEWIAAGAPAGDDTDCGGSGKEPVVTEAWPPAECDEVYKILAHGTGGLTEPVSVAVGAEVHPQVQVDAPWGTEKVQAIAFKPVTDNAKVLHHWILYSQAGAFLTGWAPGDDERSAFGKDIGMDMPTGKGSMRLDMHYFNLQGTQTEKDNSGLEVCIVKGPKLRKNSAAVTMSFASFGNGLVMAPAGASMKPITATCNVTTTSPVHLMTASPHAHQYARHMKFTVIKKDGKEIVMHDQAFKFGEQGSYGLDPEVIIETGDKVITFFFYTNETTKNITFGESTSNEMCFNFAMYYPKGALSCGGGGGGIGGFLGGGN